MDSFVSLFDANEVRSKRFQFLASLHDHRHVAPDIPLYRYLLESIIEKKAVLNVDVMIIGNDLSVSEIAAYTLAKRGKSVLFASDFPDTGENAVCSMNKARYSFMPSVVAGYVIRKLFPQSYENMPYTAFNLRRTLFSKFPSFVDDECSPLAKRLVGASVIIVGRSGSDGKFFMAPHIYESEETDKSYIRSRTVVGSMPKVKFPSKSNITKVITANHIVFTSPPPDTFEYCDDDVVKIGSAMFESDPAEKFGVVHRLRDMAGALLVDVLINDPSTLTSYLQRPDEYV